MFIWCVVWYAYVIRHIVGDCMHVTEWYANVSVWQWPICYSVSVYQWDACTLYMCCVHGVSVHYMYVIGIVCVHVWCLKVLSRQCLETVERETGNQRMCSNRLAMHRYWFRIFRLKFLFSVLQRHYCIWHGPVKISKTKTLWNVNTNNDAS